MKGPSPESLCVQKRPGLRREATTPLLSLIALSSSFAMRSGAANGARAWLTGGAFLLSFLTSEGDGGFRPRIESQTLPQLVRGRKKIKSTTARTHVSARAGKYLRVLFVGSMAGR